MTAFRFPLDRVLGWRRRQAEIEEQRLAELLAGLRRIESARATLERERADAQSAVRGPGTLPAHELWALSAYLDHASRQAAEIGRRQAEQAGRVAEQRRRLLEARRKCELLEKLKEAARADWRREADRELENFAADAYLARWQRKR